MKSNLRLALFALAITIFAAASRHFLLAKPVVRTTVAKLGGFFQYAFLPVAMAGEGEGAALDATPECRDAWGALLAVDFTHYGSFNDRAEPSFNLPRVDELFRRLEKIAAIRCVPAYNMPPRLGASVREFHRACADIEGDLRKRDPKDRLALSSFSKDGVGEACLQRTLEYRFAATTALNGARPVSSIKSLATLLNLFYDEALDPNRSYERMAKLLSRMQELEPLNYQAAMLYAQVAYAFWQTNPAARETFERAISYVETVALVDYLPLELRTRQAAHEGDAPRLRARAVQALALGYEGMGYYYLAWSDYLDGDRETAKTNLRKVLVAKISDFQWQAAVALDRLDHVTANPFTEKGITFGLFFIVPDENGETRVCTGSVYAELIREEASYENKRADVVRAFRDLRAFDQHRRHCAQKTGMPGTELAPSMSEGSPEFARCVTAALEEWGNLEVSLNEP